MAYNKELFYDSQLSNDNLTWGLRPKGANGDILIGILDENDYAFRVSHSYSGFDDPTGLVNKGKDFLNQAGDYARFGEAVIEGFDKGITNIEKDYFDGGLGIGEQINSLVTGTKEAVKYISDEFIAEGLYDKLKAANDKFKRARWFNALDFIKVFQGTTIDFSIPELKTVLLSDVGPDGGKVSEKIKLLNDKFIGSAKTYLGMFGLQDSPNNYVPEFKDLQDMPEFDGTFKLRLGTDRFIKNLIVTDYSVNLSKFKRHDPSKKLEGDYLYAEVSISLVPATYVTKEMVNNYFKLGS